MKQKDIIFILGSSLFVIFIWIIFNVYHGSVESTIPKKITNKVTPIKADFDLKTIENIKKRDQIEPLYIKHNEISTTPSATTSAIPTPALQTETQENQASLGGALLP